jgi:hypothetical protein
MFSCFRGRICTCFHEIGWRWLFLVVLLLLRRQSLEVLMVVLMVCSESLRAQDSRVLLDYMHDTPYNHSSSEVCMSNLNTYYDSLQKIEFDEPNLIDMQALLFLAVCHVASLHSDIRHFQDTTCGNPSRSHVAILDYDTW